MLDKLAKDNIPCVALGIAEEDLASEDSKTAALKNPSSATHKVLPSATWQAKTLLGEANDPSKFPY